MHDKTVAIYCIVDDALNAIGQRSHGHLRCKDSEIIATALVSTTFFSGNQAKARHYMQSHMGCCRIDKSGFTRRLHRLMPQARMLFSLLAKTFKHLNQTRDYILDSMPVPCCHNMRIRRCRLFQGKGYRGRHASMHTYFYGLRLQLLTTSDGDPVDYYIHAGAYVDRTAMASTWHIDLPEGSCLYTDGAYYSKELVELMAECEGVSLRCQLAKNAKVKDKPWLYHLKKVIRKRIETALSDICKMMGRNLHAVTAQGFGLKIELFVISYAFQRLLA